MKKVKMSNLQLLELVSSLKKQSREAKVEIWRDIGERLLKSKRRRITANLSRLNRYTSRNDIVAVPGKVLATGEMTHPITVAAFAFSGKAREKIEAAKGKCVSFSDLAKKNPTGSNVKIIG